MSLLNDAPCRGISGIVEDQTGAVWLNGSTGVIRIPASQVRDLARNSSRLNYELLDDRQGVEGTAAQVKPTPSAVEDKSGLLWFSTSGEVYSLNPSDFNLSRSKPALSIDQIKLNGNSVMDREHRSGSLRIAGINLHELEIDYIGIDLAAPEKVSYQYMLEGEDAIWREVGNRKQAFYSHLRPGNYQFRLRATSGGSDWAELKPPLSVIVTPAFYQTIWFYLLSQRWQSPHFICCIC